MTQINVMLLNVLPVLDGLEELLDLLPLALRLLEDRLGLLPPLVVHPRAGHLPQQLQPLRVRRRGHLVDLALLHDVVRVGPREAGRLQQVHDLGPRHHLLVEEVVVLLGADDPAQVHLVLVDGQPAVCRWVINAVVKFLGKI